MMAKDLMKWWGAPGKPYRTISGAPPLTYKAIEGTLKNYRIYGNTIGGESVGDLVETGEHAGEYRVPVTVTGKNLLINKAKTKTINGVKFTVNDDGSVTCNGFTNEVIRFNILPLQDSGHSDVSGNFIINGSPGVDGALMGLWVDDLALPITSEDVTYNGAVKRLFIQINENTTVNDVIFSPMIRNVNIEDGTFEPYQIPVTTNIYLPEQIKMVGNEAEYIDYEEQKQHRVRKNLLNEEYIQGNPISNSIIRVKCKTPIPLVKGELYTISFDSSSLFDVSLGSSPTPEYPFAADTTILSSCGNSLNWLTSPYTFECVNDGYISVTIRKKDNASITPDEVNFAIQFEKNSTATSYEPYIEDTELNVTLPALPTLSGTNILSIGTTVQPSEVYIKGKIKEKDPIVPAMDLSSVGTSLRTGGDPDVIAGNYADEYEGDSGV